MAPLEAMFLSISIIVDSSPPRDDLCSSPDNIAGTAPLKALRIFSSFSPNEEATFATRLSGRLSLAASRSSSGITIFLRCVQSGLVCKLGVQSHFKVGYFGKMKTRNCQHGVLRQRYS